MICHPNVLNYRTDTLMAEPLFDMHQPYAIRNEIGGAAVL
jgi:hypothetical protein